MTAVEAAIDDPQPTPIASRTRRHPAQVTADRLTDHASTYDDYLTPVERAAISRTIAALDCVPDRIRAAGGDDQ